MGTIEDRVREEFRRQGLTRERLGEEYDLLLRREVAHQELRESPPMTPVGGRLPSPARLT